MLILLLRVVCYFNPRSREGSDTRADQLFYSDIYFNPRSREGSDHLLSMTLSTSRYFNPRSREGSDSKNHQDYSR